MEVGARILGSSEYCLILTKCSSRDLIVDPGIGTRGSRCKDFGPKLNTCGRFLKDGANWRSPPPPISRFRFRAKSDWKKEKRVEPTLTGKPVQTYQKK